jgi:uncharacterized protein YndB with AHSA1/START domain
MRRWTDRRHDGLAWRPFNIVCTEIVSAQTNEEADMWEYEHTVETDLAPEAIWRRWADVASWAEWNADIETVSLDGPFDVGGLVTMTPKGDEPVQLRIAEARMNEFFVDEAAFNGVTIRTTHRLESVDGGRTRIVYRTEITGPAADELGAHIGPAITGDFPETMAALVRVAGA